MRRRYRSKTRGSIVHGYAAAREFLSQLEKVDLIEFDRDGQLTVDEKDALKCQRGLAEEKLQIELNHFSDTKVRAIRHSAFGRVWGWLHED